jgi:hypothetical protein
MKSKKYKQPTWRMTRVVHQKKFKFAPRSGPFSKDILFLSSDKTTLPFKVKVNGCVWFGYYLRGQWVSLFK